MQCAIYFRIYRGNTITGRWVVCFLKSCCSYRWSSAQIGFGRIHWLSALAI